MSTPADQLQQMQQAQEQQRLGRAVQGGLQMLLDEHVTAPIKYVDGISDLKWMLRKLLAGEFAINMDPKAAQVTTPEGNSEEKRIAVPNH